MNCKDFFTKTARATKSGGKRFEFFINDIIADLKLFVFLWFVLALYRALFIFFFRAELTNVPFGDILTAMWYGFRLSLKTSAAFIIPSFVLGTLIRQIFPGWPSLKFKFWLGAVEIFVLSLLFQTRLPYYKEFHNAFDPFIFNTFNDDVFAIVDSSIKQYNAPLRVVAGFICAAVLILLWKKWLSLNFLPKNFAGKIKRKWLVIGGIIIFIPFFAVFMRYGGSFNYNRSIYWKTSARMSSHLLNEAILDDIQALYKASRIHKKLRKIQNASYPQEEIRAALSRLTGANYGSNSLLPFEERGAQGPKINKPRHIFVIIGETYMLWPMLEQYSYLGIAEGIKGLALSAQGVLLKDFLPAANGTMFGLASVVWGLPEINIMGFSRENALKPVETSLGVIMKNLGYETRFYYGGYPSWENVGVFMDAQGFDKSFYKGNYVDLPSNAWGVEDRYFLEKTKELFDGDTPSFNVILTSSNHPPLTVNLSKEPVKTEEDFTKILPPALSGDKDLIQKLRHFEYSDKYIAQFIKDMSAKYPGSLFIFTGDHAQRWYVNPSPGIYETVAVPLVVYGQGITKDIFEQGAVASHKDIASLIVELVAPKDFLYYAFGNYPSKENTGLHNVYYIKGGCVGEIDGGQNEIVPGSWATAQDCAALAPAAQQYGKDITKAVWQRIMKGTDL